VATSGDHIYKNKEVMEIIKTEARLLRPMNYQEKALGRGFGIYEAAPQIQIGVINLQGRIFMNPAECPFAAADRAVAEISKQTNMILVDMHAEATSEKVAMGHYLDGRVSAVLGTHTHIQTADESILSGGTAYLTDVGMTGPYDSVIGREVRPVLTKLTTGMPTRFNVAKHDVRICGAVVDVDETTGKARHIQRICLKDKEEQS
jgi:metallophosphoesterase (TIGR00282 family)